MVEARGKRTRRRKSRGSEEELRGRGREGELKGRKTMEDSRKEEEEVKESGRDKGRKKMIRGMGKEGKWK